MGGPKRAGGDQRRVAAGEAGDAVDARGINGRGGGQCRQDRGEPPGQHRLSLLDITFHCHRRRSLSLSSLHIRRQGAWLEGSSWSDQEWCGLTRTRLLQPRLSAWRKATPLVTCSKPVTSWSPPDDVRLLPAGVFPHSPRMRCAPRSDPAIPRQLRCIHEFHQLQLTMLIDPRPGDCDPNNLTRELARDAAAGLHTSGEPHAKAAELSFGASLPSR
jgi:hypothetical protein